MEPTQENFASPSTSLPLVLVTGASGYLALHCVKQLLQGPYRVRGTVRDKKNTKKIQPLLRLPNANEKLQLVEADLLKPENWKQVVSGCTYVLHVASPWPIVADESTITTAVQGTETVLHAVAECPEVRKVVLTSSCSAVNDGYKNKEHIFNEDYWTNVESPAVENYAKSKTLAEKVAWNFWQSLDERTRFDLTVLNPTFITGPVLSDVEHGSATIIGRMMFFTKFLASPKVSLGVVDVRDVALAHIRSLERPETNGQRILVTATPSVWFKEMTTWLDEEFKQYGYKISVIEVPNVILKVYAATGIDPQAKAVLHRTGAVLRFDNSKSIRLLGMEYRDPRSSIIAMMHSMLSHQMVKQTKKYQRYVEQNERRTRNIIPINY